MSIGTAPRWALDAKTSTMSDPARYAVAYDGGTVAIGADRTSWLAYPDICRLDGVAACGCGGDWTNCSWAVYCSAQAGDYRWATDPTFRKKNANPRHLGGVNLGYMDGHAAWINSQALLSKSPRWRSEDAFLNAWPSGLTAVVPQDDGIVGLYPMWNPTTTADGQDFSSACGVPPIW